MKLRILHTNDLHSSYDAFKRVVTCINKHRNDMCLVVDAGDMIDRKSVMISGSDGIAGTRLLFDAGYDAITIGNNEGFSSALLKMVKESKVPFVCANLYNINGDELPIQKSILKTYGDVRVLIIGNTVDGSESYNEFFAFTNIKAHEYIKCVRDELEKNKGNYDLCVVLSHAGIRRDREMAEAIDGIDVIIGGHSHTVLEDVEVVNGTLIHQAGKYGQYVGMVDLELNEMKKIISYQGSLLTVNDYDEDERICNLIDTYRDEAVENLSKPLFTIKEDLWHDVVNENPITNLLADALYDLHKDEVDFGIINSGILNYGLPKGEVSELQLIGCSPSPLNPTRYHVSGKEALKQSLDFEYCLENRFASGFRGYYTGNLQVSYNVAVYVEGRTIKEVYINGSLMEDDKQYYIISSDYIQRGSGYPTLYGDDYLYDNYEIRDLVRLYSPKEEFVTRALQKRIIK